MPDEKEENYLPRINEEFLELVGEAVLKDIKKYGSVEYKVVRDFLDRNLGGCAVSTYVGGLTDEILQTLANRGKLFRKGMWEFGVYNSAQGENQPKS